MHLSKECMCFLLSICKHQCLETDEKSRSFIEWKTQWLRFNCNFQAKIQTTMQIKVNFIWCKIYISRKRIKFHKLVWLHRCSPICVLPDSVLWHWLSCLFKLSLHFLPLFSRHHNVAFKCVNAISYTRAKWKQQLYKLFCLLRKFLLWFS